MKIKNLFYFVLGVFLLVCVLFYHVANAQTSDTDGVITFAWDANSETDLAGYKLYQSETTGQDYYLLNNIPLEILQDSSNPTFTIQGVLEGVHYWVLTAYDIDGLESDYSDEVNATVNFTAPDTPTAFKIVLDITVRVQ